LYELRQQMSAKALAPRRGATASSLAATSLRVSWTVPADPPSARRSPSRGRSCSSCGLTCVRCASKTGLPGLRTNRGGMIAAVRRHAHRQRPIASVPGCEIRRTGARPHLAMWSADLRQCGRGAIKAEGAHDADGSVIACWSRMIRSSRRAGRSLIPDGPDRGLPIARPDRTRSAPYR